MKNDKASVTAETPLLYRALESRKSEDARVCYDPLAECFIGPRSTVMGDSIVPEPIMRWFYNLLMPGVEGYIISRTRCMDDYLASCVEDGLEQFVLLGAGYDTRAYRFFSQADNIPVFEVDHPATQKRKRQKLASAFSKPHDYVHYVSVDFLKDSLMECLLQAGYSPDKKTLFLWEGVTFYISAESIDQTLRIIKENSGRDSSVIFDYIHPDVLEGIFPRREAKLWRRCSRGEPILFGIKPEDIESFLTERGFSNIKNHTADDFQRMYFHGNVKKRFISPMFFIVHATVSEG